MEQIACSEMLAYKIQTTGNYPEGNIQQKIRFFIYQFLQTLVPFNIRELAEALGNAHFNITQFQ
jgi:hypothetical protein